MNKQIRSLVSGTIALFLVLLFSIVPVKAWAATTTQSLAVPVFSNPATNSFWTDVRAAGSNSVGFTVANPLNGPGAKADPVYGSAIAQNASANIRTLGYVKTNYQIRSFKDAYSDVDKWYSYYPQTSGIYLDQLKEGGQDEVCYVAALYTHVKNTHPNDLVVLGANGHISTAYEPYGDIFVGASTDYTSYQAWRTQYKGFEDKQSYQNRFWHMIYGVSPDQIASAFAQARANNAGWVFITDKPAQSPFSTTPSYWQNEANDVGALPASSIPNRGKTTLPRGCISLSSSGDHIIDSRTAKQVVTSSKITVSNTSAVFDSEPTTTIKFISLPKGLTVNAMTTSGWNCDLNSKSCTSAAIIPATTALPVIATSVTADCDYAGGDATLRLTNYAGNQWDLKVPVRAPFGCEAGTAAAKLNSDNGGTIQTVTTQSQETTPDITPLGGTAAADQQTQKTAQKSNSLIKAIIIAALVVALLCIAGWVAWFYYRRSRYSVKL